MDWNDNETQAAFRKEVREFITTELPDRYRSTGMGAEQWGADRHSRDPQRIGMANEWVKALSKRGWIPAGRRSTAAPASHLWSSSS